MAKRNVKSSKTDHVLNMLTSAPPEGEGADNSAELQKKLVPPIIEVANTKNEELSNAIDSALKQELEETIETPEVSAQEQTASENIEPAPQEEASPSAEAESETQASADTAQDANEEAASKTQENTVDAKEATAPTEQAAPASTQTTAEEKPQESAPSSNDAQQKEQKSADAANKDEHPGIFVNVMEEIVDEMVLDYIKKFKTCSCKRCQSDIKAFALSNLPSKYVVLTPTTVVPMMGFYKSKFDTLAKSKLIVACKLVGDNPRHEGFRNSY